VAGACRATRQLDVYVPVWQLQRTGPAPRCHVRPAIYAAPTWAGMLGTKADCVKMNCVGQNSAFRMDTFEL
jgi:hypothetical protein